MKSLNKWLVLFGAAVSVVSVGCGGPMEGEPTPEDATPEAEVSASVCSYGYYTCPSDGEIFEYESPVCGPTYMTKTLVKSRCEAHCPTTCRDSGWMTY